VQHGVDQGGFSVVNVGDYGDIAKRVGQLETSLSVRLPS